jgi:SAM-dependent methyltransferase
LSLSETKASSATATARAISFCCPRCKGELESGNNLYRCPECCEDYPVVLGIPDFRVFSDPYISLEDDRKKGIYLYEHSRGLDFEGLLRLYWSITPGVSAARAEGFIQRALSLDGLGEEQLARFELVNSCLEVGCATGGLLISASRKCAVVAGVDIAFRWLTIARLRLESLGLHLPLICACAEFLPFKDDTFDLILANDVLDHLADQGAALREWNRVGRDGGQMLMTTPNRFSLASEPHVQVWGVGLLPRRLMSPYVRLARRIPDEHLRLVSYPELSRLLRENGFEDHEVTAPALNESQTRRLSTAGRIAARTYGWMRLTPVFREGLLFFGPLLEVVGRIRKGIPLLQNGED